MGIAERLIRLAGQAVRNPRLLLQSPRRAAKLATFHLLGRNPFEPESLLPHRGEPAGSLAHVAAYTDCNAGDTLLPVCVRDVIMAGAGSVTWEGLHAHHTVQRPQVARINSTGGLVIGGGGLFLKDTNPNQLSGWQWRCSLESLQAIDVPIALFAVGYNRFRGQGEFDEIFTRHLTLLAEKCVLFGLRNTGSIERVREYLPASLREKVTYQPCPTTLIARLYPHLVEGRADRQPAVALNCAFDRASLRFGDRLDGILADIASAMKTLSRRVEIRYFAHTRQDETMLPHLEAAGVPYRLVKLYEVPSETVIAAYADCSLAIGMRGHAQMIPFGCGVPILSLISHDKLRWFLQDVGMESRGVEVDAPKLETRLNDEAHRQLDDVAGERQVIDAAQQRLWDLTMENVRQMAPAFGLGG